MKKQFHIGEISEFFNLPASTLRHWESTGIWHQKRITKITTASIR